MYYQEKRANSRITIRDDVTLVVHGKADSDLCVLEDISQGGARFCSTQKLSIGSQVELRVPSPENDPDIVIQGIILRVGPGDYNKSYCYACTIEAFENA